ncbi:AAA family ATPase [Actinomycetaceae bacterium TAE3-ERU4]|nr:AAA family ATPase [Actinomycetaceae bacterium TAE3-ERU4]
MRQNNCPDSYNTGGSKTLTTNSKTLGAQIDFEQQVVTEAYRVLDETRRLYRQRQAQAQAKGASGSHQARTERDAISSHFGDEAARLEQMEDRLVFGKLTGTDGSVRYIGRTGLVNNHDERILMDWRAPAALPFYQATAVHPLGVAHRRHILTRLRKVVGVEDDLLSKSEKMNADLQGEGALMAALSEARTGHMNDIVATIQAEQDRVIRSQADGIMVVQGGPGTGKTAVALHRAAYLLYAEHKRLERTGVLIVGPSPTFLRYIEKVLPSLGETGVVSLTPQTLVPGIKPDLEESAHLARLKGDIRWSEAIKKAIQALQRLPKHDLKIQVGSRHLTISREDFKYAQTKARRTGLPHNEAWSTYAKTMLDVLAQKLTEGSEKNSEEFSWALFDLRANNEIRKAINLHWLPCSATELLARLYADPKRLAHAASFLSVEDLPAFLRPLSLNRWSTADIALLDEAYEILGEHPQAAARAREKEREQAQAIENAQAALDTGFNVDNLVSATLLAERANTSTVSSSTATRAAADRAWTYGHVVVDEAQDLSPMQWRALLRRCPARSFTVVGDLDQQRINHGADSWSDVLGPAAEFLNCEVILETSYRTPATIMNAAIRVMQQLGQPVKYPVKSVRDLENCLAYDTYSDLHAASHGALQATIGAAENISKEENSSAGRIALIVPDSSLIPTLKTKIPPKYQERIWVTIPSQTKGLEFDSVIVLDPSRIAKHSLGDLFVSLTRSTKTLYVAEVGNELPGLRG